jgi:hypothetical protein
MYSTGAMKIHLSTIAAVLSLGFAVVAAAADPPADLILLHGKIHTVAQALAIRGNEIVAVGTDQVVSALKGPKTQTIDLAGRVVLPGIIDAHIHPAESAQDLGKCSLEDKMLAPAEIKAKVAVCLQQQPVDHTLWFEVVQVNPSRRDVGRSPDASQRLRRPHSLG